MRSIKETINALKNGEYDDKLTYLYSCDKNNVKKYSDRYIDVINGFEETFGKDGDIALFSAPGRTEIGGNHTDHHHGAGSRRNRLRCHFFAQFLRARHNQHADARAVWRHCLHVEHGGHLPAHGSGGRAGHCACSAHEQGPHRRRVSGICRLHVPIKQKRP